MHVTKEQSITCPVKEGPNSTGAFWSEAWDKLPVLHIIVHTSTLHEEETENDSNLCI